MKIGVDLRPLVLGASGGISQLVKGVCEHMFALHPGHQFLVFCTPFNRSLLDYDAEHVRYFCLSIATYFQDLDRMAMAEGLHVLFRAYPIEDTLQFPLRKQVYLIPDNQHEIYPEFFAPEDLRSRRIGFSNALDGAGAIGTISEFARKALLDFPGTRCKDVFLMQPSLQVVHGLRRGEGELSDSERTRIPQTDYFLFPANLWKHKNHPRLFRAFGLFRERTGRDISLILTGHPAGWLELSREFPDLPLVHLGFVRPELLRALLEHASALVFFSLYEGFGIPLLEAFDAGTPVICSNTTSLPEVGGDAVLTCDPTDIEAMATLMERILVDDELRRTLVQRGRKRLAAYSWEKSAHSLMAACERVMAAETIFPRLPLVSIVTPSYNQGRFIEETILSILTQDYPNIEYIVIDGASTDNTLEILKKYDGRLTWISEPDRGQSHAINKGFRMAKGDILAWLNSDDTYLPGAISKAVQHLQANPEAMMVYGEGYLIDEQSRITRRFPYTEAFNLWKLVYLWDNILQQTAFFRRQIFDHIALLDEGLHYAMDWDLWIRIGKKFRVDYIPEYLGNLREYQEAKTSSGGITRFNELVSLMRRHGNRRFPPGYFTYGFGTYNKRVFGSLPDRYPRAYQIFLFKLRKMGQYFCGRVTQYLVNHSQGYYSDGWTSRKAHFLLANPGQVSYLRLEGELLNLRRGYRTAIRARLNGRPLGGPITVAPGNFKLEWSIPEEMRSSELLEVTLLSTRWFVPYRAGVGKHRRRLSYRVTRISAE